METTFIVLVLLVTVVGFAQLAFDVNAHEIISPFINELVEYVEELAPPILFPFNFH